MKNKQTGFVVFAAIYAVFIVSMIGTEIAHNQLTKQATTTEVNK